MRQNLTAHLGILGANLPSPLDSISRELVKWCLLRGCAWSGTPSELLDTLKTTAGVLDNVWPASPSALFAHIAAHQETLRSSGIDITVSGKFPRILCLKPRQITSVAKSSLVVNATNYDQAHTSHAGVSETRSDKDLVNRASTERSPESPRLKNVPWATSPGDDVQRQNTGQANPACNKLSASTPSSSAQKDGLCPFVEGDTSSSVAKQPARSEAGKIQPPASVPSLPEDRSESSAFRSVADALATISDLQEQIRTRAQSQVNARASTATSDRMKQVVSLVATTTTDDPVAKPNSSDQVRTAALSSAESVANISPSAEDNFAPPIFDSAAEALLAIVNMQEQIGKRYLDPNSIIQSVAERTKEISGATSVAIALVRCGEIVYSSEAGMTGTDSELFRSIQSTIETGEILQLQDSQTDPLDAFRLPAGMKSLIILPFEVKGDTSGAIRVVFQERRQFQNADIITLQLIGKVIDEAINDALSRASSMSTSRQQLATTGEGDTGTTDSAQPLDGDNTLTGWKLLLKRHLKHR